ncbi:MAG: hypothetical protein U9R38_03085 [Candidatus Margulisiibacteriota bacterium]|nr:hypothetical protein [Candidatus Margulisiibacteriota bacterium]
MARKKMYVIQHGVMRPKWIDPKHIFDVPDEPVVPVSLPAPEPEKKAPEKPKDTIMVADEPSGPRRAVKLKDGKPVEKKEEAKLPEKKEKVEKKGSRRGRSR